MADIPEPDFDEQHPADSSSDSPDTTKASKESTANSSTTGSTLDAAETLRQQVAAQIQGHTDAPKPLTEEEKKEIDTRSVHVSGVDYSVTQAELQQLFEKCGEIVRAKILTDKTGRPKGFAYIEFAHIDSVSRALELTDTVLKSRTITVNQKRTNVPGMKRGGGQFGGPARGGFVGYMPIPYGMMPMRGRGGPHRTFSPRGGGRDRSKPY